LTKQGKASIRRDSLDGTSTSPLRGYAQCERKTVSAQPRSNVYQEPILSVRAERSAEGAKSKPFGAALRVRLVFSCAQTSSD